MNDPTPNAPNESTSRPSGGQADAPFGRREASPAGDEWEQAQLAFDVAKAWVQEHQTAAMLGAFALGTFIGAMMRD